VDRLIASFDQSGFGGIRNDLGVDLVASFEQTEDDGLAAGSSASSAAHATRAKVRLVGLDFALEWRVALTGFGHPLSHSKKNRVHGSDRDAGDAAVCVAVRSNTKQRTRCRNRASPILKWRKYLLTTMPEH
jgi:hypothetical protein